jgi:hypothetical protein
MFASEAGCGGLEGRKNIICKEKNRMPAQGGHDGGDYK